ncbi:MAG: hypothetical protein ABFE02_17335 [Sulfuricella sp.]
MARKNEIPLLKNKDLLPFTAHVPHLNMEAVAAAILKVDHDAPALAQFEFEEVKRMVWAAAEKWFDRDMREFELTGIEKRVDRPDGKGFLDVVGRMRGRMKPFDAFAGQTFIIDWKTSKNALDAAWKDRLLDSWQWRMYAEWEQARVFIYRGVSRGTDIETREVILAVGDTNGQEVYEYLAGTEAARRALIEARLPVWPRHMPSACLQYGLDHECEFFAECLQYSMPQKTITPGVLSYTAAERFWRCPELYRRGVLSPEKMGSSSSEIGEAFHRGMAELYRQGIERQKEME